LPVEEIEFDVNPYLLGLPNKKVVDLREGMKGVRDREPSYLVTMQTRVFPVAGKTPTLEAFRLETHKGKNDADTAQRIAYIRRLNGYCITGKNSLQLAWMFDGLGANGKSTEANIMRELLGDYGRLANENIFSTGYSGHPTELFDLCKRRVIVVDEVGSGLTLNSTFKKMVSGRKIKARPIGGDEREVRIMCKIIFNLNTSIRFDAASASFRRRIKMFPFDNSIVELRKNSISTKRLSRTKGWRPSPTPSNRQLCS
jgi:putative DNA primase/helicase